MLNLEKLPPAPWVVFGQQAYGAGGGSDYPMLLPEDEDDEGDVAALEFAALARNALDVMLRRGWSPALWRFGQRSGGPFWALNTNNLPPDGKFYSWVIDQEFPDPFTALVEADKWYSKNVDQPKGDAS